MNQILKREEVSKPSLIKFLSEIIDEIDFQKKNQEDIAKVIGISPGTFSKNLTGKIQFNFWNLIKLSKILYVNDINKQRKMIHNFCSVTTSKKNLRIAMEYANAKGDLSLLKLVVDQEKISSLAMNREWAYAYEFVLLRSNGTIKKQELLSKLEERKGSKIIKTKEMKVLYGILTFYTMYDLEKYNSLFEYAEMLLPDVNTITDSFIKSSYLGRIKEGLAYAYLVQDNLEMSRGLCKEILEIEDPSECFHLLRASALAYIAESYTFDCYDSASWYMKKALVQLGSCNFEREKQRKQSILNTYSFIKLVNKKDLDSIKIYNVGEEALYQILLGNPGKAVEILRAAEKKDGKLSAMKKCILGYALKDINLIEESIVAFECAGNRFYSKFPKKIVVEFNKNGIIYEGGAI
ncbi:AimR family lysis-lysogeny pheromone receptor [Bacillus cereus]|nr:AimR family lysis-lysogeny pheromone receptor [Bacillus cereus]